MRKVINILARLVPNRVKEILLGSPSNPSRVAHLIHRSLNRIPGEAFPCLTCSGFLEGYKMRVDWSHFRAFAYGTWEPEIVEAVTEVVCKGFVAIDVGAHLGYYALILSRLVGPKGHVIAFEPMPSNFQILSENVRLNDCTNIDTVNKAVSDRSGQFEADLPTESKLPSSFSLLETKAADSIIVDTTCLDDFLRDWNQRIDFIQIDVEGAEAMVLKGARRIIEKYHPIMLVEVHHFGASLDSSQVPRQLTELGYELKWLLKWHSTSHVLATWKSATGVSRTARDNQA